MTFKSNWEKADQSIQVKSQMIREMVRQALPNNPLLTYKVISGGCANLNMKVHVEKESYPFILRLYLRDKEAAYREKNLGALLKHTVPAPLIYYVGDYENYRFALTEFLPGITLRDLLLGNEPHDMGALMNEAGRLLGKIQTHTFPKPGFFDIHLTVSKNISQGGYKNFVQNYLQKPMILNLLSGEVIRKIHSYTEKYAFLFPENHESHLVHGDFDPANILVHKIKGKWEITGILDWEFSFSGSVLCDVANMLRYAHHMPPLFEDSFLQGLREGGIQLPHTWQISIYLLNLLSLLDCLGRSDPTHRPKQWDDMHLLINYFLQRLDEKSQA
jgi:aminoglycoside phosphotransferase (APT) family kinase protein